MAGQLTRFRIEGLEHRPTIDIPITNNQFTLMMDDNGSANKTVTNLVYFFLTRQWSWMLEYQFERILAVIDGADYQFSREHIRHLAEQGDSQKYETAELPLAAPVLDLPPLTSKEPSGADFLLSIAGMFDSGEPNETSENVKPLVADLIAQKHGK